jgi:hypothetical protein
LGARGCHQRLQFIKYSAAKSLGFHGQSHPLFISEPKQLSLDLLLEDTVLFDEIINNHLLLAIEPAGHGDFNLKQVRNLFKDCGDISTVNEHILA